MNVAFRLSQVVIVIMIVIFFTILGIMLSFGVQRNTTITLLGCVSFPTTLDPFSEIIVPMATSSLMAPPSVASRIDYLWVGKCARQAFFLKKHKNDRF